MKNFESSNLCKRHGILLGICTRRTKKEISDFISRRMVENVRKETEDLSTQRKIHAQ